MHDKLDELRKWIQDAVDGGFTPVTISTSNLVYLMEEIDALKIKNKWLKFQLEREMFCALYMTRRK